MQKLVALSLSGVLALGPCAVRAQDAQPLNPNAMRIYNSALAAAAYGAAKADELRVRTAKERYAAAHSDPQKTFRTTLAAANRGDLDAQLQVGTMYAKGTGVKRNEIQAIDWWTKASTHGEEAQSRAADRFAEILQAQGMPPQQAKTMAMAALLARYFGAGTRRQASHSSSGDSSTLVGHMMMHDFFEDDEPIGSGSE